MKQKTIGSFSIRTAIVLFVMMLSSATQTAWAKFSGGDGSEETPYQIANASDLAQLAADVNGGEKYDNVYFEQTAPITLNGEWTPIGIDDSHPFAGHYNGNDNTISGLTVTGNFKYAGLFGCLRGERYHGSIRSNKIARVRIVDCNINVGSVRYSKAGAIAGYACNVLLSDCHATGTVTGYGYAGGLIGAVLEHYGNRVEYCFTDVTLSATCKQYNEYETPYVRQIAYFSGANCSSEGNYYHDKGDGISAGCLATPLYVVSGISDELQIYDKPSTTSNFTGGKMFGNYYYAANTELELYVYHSEYQFIKSFSVTGTGATGSVSGDRKSAIVTVGSSDVNVSATFKTLRGTLDNGIIWTLDKDGNGDYTELKISGNGDIPDFGYVEASVWHTDAPWGYDLTSVIIGGNITSIGRYAFIGCQSLANVSIGANVTDIGQKAFDHCDALTTITLPVSVTSLHQGAFYNCRGLQRVNIVHPGAVSIAGQVFQKCNALQYIVFRTPEVALANTTGNWSGYTAKFRTDFGGYLFGVTNDGGTAAYKIATEGDLRNLAAAINANEHNRGMTFRQTADIDLTSGGNFTPIGCNVLFEGTYDGGGYTISGLTVNGDYNDAGLFGDISNGAIRNVILVSPSINAPNNNFDVGALAGFCYYATIENCYAVNPTVSGSGKFVGALVGFISNGGKVTNCYYYGGNATAAIGHIEGNGEATRVTSAHLLTLSDGVSVETAMSADHGFSYDSDGNGTPENYWGTGTELTLAGLPTDDPEPGYQYTYTATAGTVSDSQLTVADEDATVGYVLKTIEWRGEGTKDSPYIIEYPSQLLMLAYRVNGTHGETANPYKGTYFKLGANIKFPHADNEGDNYADNYEAIGIYNKGEKYFNGNFDGDGYTVSGIRIRNDGTGDHDQCYGLFARTETEANIHDVRVTDARIRANNFVGGIVGYTRNSTIRDCIVTNSSFAVRATKNTACGAISGGSWANADRNYYYGCSCSVNGVTTTSRIGAGCRDMTYREQAVPMRTLSLANGTDNSVAIADAMTVGKPYAVTLADRTLTKDGAWNTLCLPFSLSAGQIEVSPLAGAVIREMDSSTNLSSNGVLTLNFKDAKSIEAGKAYIVKWTTPGESITEPVFIAGSIENADLTGTESTDGNVKFVGQYSPFTIDESNINSILFIGSSNKIGYSKNPRQLKSCRAHFWVRPNGDTASARSISVDFGDGVTTSINLVEAVDANTANTADGIYTIDGRKIKGEMMQKGVYVVKGKKVVK